MAQQSSFSEKLQFMTTAAQSKKARAAAKKAKVTLSEWLRLAVVSALNR